MYLCNPAREKLQLFQAFSFFAVFLVPARTITLSPEVEKRESDHT
jgi:hypothetical protein